MASSKAWAFVAALVMILVFASPLTGLATAETDSSAGVSCAGDVKICPDGTAVGRMGLDCEFSPCPGETGTGNTAQPEPEPADPSSGETSEPGATPTNPVNPAPPIARPCVEAKRINALIQAKKAQIASSATPAASDVQMKELAELHEKYRAAFLACGNKVVAPVVKPIIACVEKAAIKKRISYIKELLALTDEELAAKGYVRADIKAKLKTHEGMLAKAPENCQVLGPLPVLANPTPCRPGPEILREYQELASQLEEAEASGDKELAAQIMEKLAAVKQEASNNRCVVMAATVTAVAVKPGAIDGGAVPSEGPCGEARNLDKKRVYYKELLALTDEELAAKGYVRASVEETIVSIDAEMRKAAEICKGAGVVRQAIAESAPCVRAKTLEAKIFVVKEAIERATASGSDAAKLKDELARLESEQTDAVKDCAEKQVIKPVAPDSGTEISGYYKEKVAAVMGSTSDINGQIYALKDMRREIDKMIAELVRKRAKLNAEEIADLDATITVNSDGIEVGDEVISSDEGKEIVADVEGNNLTILQGEGTISLDDGSGIGAEAESPVEIESGDVKVGNAKVRILPAQLRQRLKFDPKEVKLKAEGNAAVYVGKGQEERKLFFVVPVKVEAKFKVDATTGQTISEERPWWTFLSSKMKEK